MSNIERIQQAICYMEEHILEDISYVEAAKSVHMSSYNFHRTFSFITGMTANEYIRSRRLTLAGQELLTTACSVTEAAYKYGYESPESFSRAFSRFHGSTPRQVMSRQVTSGSDKSVPDMGKGASLHLFNPLVIKITVEGGSIMDYRIEHRESQRFLALKRAFSNENSMDENGRSSPEFWDECHDKGLIEPVRSLRPEGKRDLYGLCSPRDSEGSFDYGIGIILDEDTDPTQLERLVKEGCFLWEASPADYAVFKCIGSDGACIGETWSKFFKEFVPQTGYTQTDDTDYEIYFENGESDVFCELWIPVRKG